MKIYRLVASVFAGLGLLSVAEAAPKWAKKGDTIVKCKGVARKGKNDCGANGHSCSGKAVKDTTPMSGYMCPKVSARKSLAV